MKKISYEERRRRNIQKKFRVTEEENELIMKKMELAGYNKISDYLIRMAIDGFIIVQDYDNFIAVSKQLNEIGKEINYIAHRANIVELHEEKIKRGEAAGDRVAEISIADIQRIDKHMENIWLTLNKILEEQSGSKIKEQNIRRLKKEISKDKGNADN